MGEQKRREAAMSDYERAIQDLTRKPTDDGHLIEAGWVGLRQMWLPADAPEHQVADLRKAFMAGAQHTWGSIMNMLDPGDDPTTADLSRMDKIQKELDAFGAEIARDHYPTKGSA
ncbi:hypothetical protein HCU64_06355 [Methylobacterium sp. C25]|uniref:hypothetical protein n=1 Tax=Methylobacterium sp. C25 TaxID=2721622 RepID=UPI001F1FCF9E|nr:hypothetical protein [Methylobacterium sp. C25]MCE4223367.1 hypothetical protein [Methylobacterium sp. C25]